MNYSKFVFIVLTVLLLQSCETDIPETDTTPPEFTFRITGDGFEHTFKSEDDFNDIQLNLRAGVEYDFIYAGSDNGGVKLIRWQVPGSDNIDFTSGISSPWTIRNLSPLARMIEWAGDENNAITGNVLTGRFRAEGEQASVLFGFYVSDFGGESGSPNTVLQELFILIADHETELKSI